MKKILITFILLFPFITHADYVEDLLNLKTGAQEIKLNFIELKNPHLKDREKQQVFYQLQRINPKIKKAIIKQYKAGRFGYYQTLGLIRHYNNFLYYANKYFESLKNKEIYGNTKEIKQNIYTNFLNMSNYYFKFATLAKQKNMN